MAGKVISISAKCSDMFSASLSDRETGKYLGKEYVGYVPDFMPGDSEDYITLYIDAKTGQILNWETPTAGQLKKVFKI
jgi:hypothetical protein